MVFMLIYAQLPSEVLFKTECSNFTLPNTLPQ